MTLSLYLIAGVFTGAIGVLLGRWRQQPLLGAFLVSFLLGPLGWLFVAIASPDSKRTRPCPACLATVPRAATACSHCGRDLPPAPNQKSEPDRVFLGFVLLFAVIGIGALLVLISQA